MLLVNDGLLPLDHGGVSSLAVIGPNAAQLAMGGGSSEVTPHRRRGVAEALAERLPGARHRAGGGVSHRPRPASHRHAPGVPGVVGRLVTARSEGGFSVEYFDNPDLAGQPVGRDEAHAARIMWIGPPYPGLRTGACSVRISGRFTPDVAGAWRLGLESAGRSMLRLDGDIVIDNTDPTRGSGFYGAGSELVDVVLDLAAGHTYQLAVDVWPRSTTSPIMGARIGGGASGHRRRVRAGGGGGGRGRRGRRRRRIQW